MCAYINEWMSVCVTPKRQHSSNSSGFSSSFSVCLCIFSSLLFGISLFLLNLFVGVECFAFRIPVIGNDKLVPRNAITALPIALCMCIEVSMNSQPNRLFPAPFFFLSLSMCMFPFSRLLFHESISEKGY